MDDKHIPVMKAKTSADCVTDVYGIFTR